MNNILRIFSTKYEKMLKHSSTKVAFGREAEQYSHEKLQRIIIKFIKVMFVTSNEDKVNTIYTIVYNITDEC